MVLAALQSRQAVPSRRVMEYGMAIMSSFSHDNSAIAAQLGELGACAGECMLLGELL